jgi:translocation and assembly module TamB
LSLGRARVEFAGGAIDMGETKYDRGRLRSSGAFTGVPAAKLIAYSKRKLPIRTTLVIGGDWRIEAHQQVDGQLKMHREAGDVSVTAADRALALGVQEITAKVDVANNRVAAQLLAHGTRVGRITARAQTEISKRGGNWGVSSRSPLALSAQARLNSLKPIAALYGTSIDFDGRLAVDVQGKGTLAQPGLRGEAKASQLRIEQVKSGLLLHDGSVQAAFDDRGVDVTAIRIKAGEGSFSATGRVFNNKERLIAQLNWQAANLAAVQKPDLYLSLSGAGRFSYERERIALSGALTVDRGRVELQPGNAPKLGDDVLVVGQENDAKDTPKISPALDVTVDLGSDFLVTGRGIDTRLEGKLALRSPGDAPIAASGEIRLAGGTYEAYGRKLTIERGKLVFDGPLDNPALDLRAMRKNQQVEAGVEVRGTAKAPQVRLVSNPEVPDTEKLAWLVLGRPIAGNNPTDAQALQRSAALLLADVGISPLQKQVAKGLGLDELSFSPGESGSAGGVVTIAKRLSDRIYVMLEQSLTAAGSALKVNYQLSQRWSVRTESGATDAVDLFYSLSFD